jgi:hypothetical protein
LFGYSLVCTFRRNNIYLSYGGGGGAMFGLILSSTVGGGGAMFGLILSSTVGGGEAMLCLILYIFKRLSLL